MRKWVLSSSITEIFINMEFYKMAMCFRFVFRSCFVNLEVNREKDGGEGERKKAEGN